MKFEKNWFSEEKGSPGRAEALTGDNRKKNTLIISNSNENCKDDRYIYGQTVFFLCDDGSIGQGIVTGEFCPDPASGVFFYHIKLPRDGRWLLGTQLFRTETEAHRRSEWRNRSG